MLRTGLLDLPEDVLVQHILGRLDFRDVLRCSMVCKTLYRLKDASSALLLEVELGADGIADTTIPYRLLSGSSAVMRGAPFNGRRSTPSRFPCLANMTFDPSQDLLAVIEHRGNSGPHPKITRDADGELTIHLRSLTSNQTHPLATKSVLRTFFQRGWSTIITSHNVQKFEIFDDMLALLCSYNYRSTHVSIWNWKSGEVVLERMLCRISSLTARDLDAGT